MEKGYSGQQDILHQIGLSEVPKWEFWKGERTALRDGERTSKMNVVRKR